MKNIFLFFYIFNLFCVFIYVFLCDIVIWICYIYYIVCNETFNILDWIVKYSKSQQPLTAMRRIEKKITVRTHKAPAVRNKPGWTGGDWQEVRGAILENQCACWCSMQWLTAERKRTLPAEVTTIPPSWLGVNRRCPLV